MKFGIITSKNFDKTNLPLIKKEIIKRGHLLIEFKEKKISCLQIKKLLDVDVLWDRSKIMDDNFFLKLNKIHSNKKTFIINDPLATINSYNKLKTHKLLRKYFPESYIVNKTNFNQIYLKIKSKEWVVIKRNKGLHGEGVFKIKPSQIKKYLGKESMILQDYIEPKMGIGRCLCLNYKNNFKEIATYSRFPEKTWKTGTNSNSKIKKIKTNEKLYEFCKKVSKKSKLFINGIDFIESDGKYYLLEINSVPRISTVKSKFGINSPKIILDFIESNIKL